MITQTFFLLACVAFVVSRAPASPQANDITVSAKRSLADSGGRLLIFVTRKTRDDEHAPENVDIDLLHPSLSTIVIGQNVRSMSHSYRVKMDGSESAPIAFTELAPGEYWMQAVLDVAGTYARYGRGAGNVLSSVNSVRVPLQTTVSMTLDRRIGEEDPWNPPNASPTQKQQLSSARANVVDFAVPSPSLSNFFKHPISIKAWVVLPPGYSSKSSQVWPTVYALGAYGSHHLDRNDIGLMGLLVELSKKGSLPPFIWVFPDYSVNTGVTEFMDSVNDGPWGKAFTQEFLPALENRFATDSRQSARFLWGHSSGGWASVWMQLNHPDLFGGAWASAPDSCDFHDFVGADLYAQKANLYRDESNNPRPIVRQHGMATATLRDWVHIEDVLGTDGGVFRSYDWIFSPKGKDGRPQFMFDHKTGEVNSAVVSFWGDHFDASRLIALLSRERKAPLQDALHIYVGTEDTHYLDGSVRLLKATMDKAGLSGQVVFVQGRNHNDLYTKGDDPLGLLKVFAAQMTQVADKGRSQPP